MTDNVDRPQDDRSRPDLLRAQSERDHGVFEQLTLDATVVGPGMRTEDHYEPGAKLRIRGERGVFVYKHASVSKAGLVSLHLAGEGGTRAVRPDTVVPVRRRIR